MTNLKRFLLGVLFTLIPVILLYTGIIFVNIWLVYFGAFILGIGSALTYLPTIGYIKYFPPYVLSFYVSGLTFAGFSLSLCYLLALTVNFRFSQVIRDFSI